MTEQAEAGLWVPIYFGTRFKIARLKSDRRRTQEEKPKVYKTLKAAQLACVRLNIRSMK